MTERESDAVIGALRSAIGELRGAGAAGSLSLGASF
jgi:hypothetical protein